MARFAELGAGVYCVLYGVTGALIGMAGKIVLPSLSNTDGALPPLREAVLPVGVSGLVAAAALAALMSTASACLLASSPSRWRTYCRLSGASLPAGWAERFTTLLMGMGMLGLAFVVRDVLAALTLAYNLLVGGMLIPLVGAIFWPRATSAGAIASMLTSSLCVVGLMALARHRRQQPNLRRPAGRRRRLRVGQPVEPPGSTLQPQKPSAETTRLMTATRWNMNNRNVASRPKRSALDRLCAPSRAACKVWHQAPFWFTGNFVLTTMVVGFTGRRWELGALYSMLAIAAGVGFGTFFMACHANQGPHGAAADDPVRAQF
nr:cytosine permease [Serratia marcescens]